MYQKSRCCCYAWRAKQHHLGWRQHLDRFCHFKKNQSLSKHSKLFPKIKNKSKRRKQHCSKGVWVKAKEWETKHKCKSQNERNEIDLMWWTDGAGWRFIAQASSLLNLILWLWHGHFAPCICLFFETWRDFELKSRLSTLQFRPHCMNPIPVDVAWMLRRVTPII